MGIWRIERYFDSAETRFDNDCGDRIGLVRRDAAQDGDERGRSKLKRHKSRSVASDAKEPARCGPRRRRASRDAKRVERGAIPLDQRLRARNIWLLAGIKAAPFLDLRSDEEARKIFARVVLRKRSHEWQRSRAKQQAEQA